MMATRRSKNAEQEWFERRGPWVEFPGVVAQQGLTRYHQNRLRLPVNSLTRSGRRLQGVHPVSVIADRHPASQQSRDGRMPVRCTEWSGFMTRMPRSKFRAVSMEDDDPTCTKSGRRNFVHKAMRCASPLVRLPDLHYAYRFLVVRTKGIACNGRCLDLSRSSPPDQQFLFESGS